ncbi:MAG: histidine kinase [Sulfuricurvum sp. RIFCSPLOWO2_12_43_5]|nr:MAG: histidine kinase [Sulfuricurvum sp. RIFCSPHIGHO2_02_FULL_43_9]OHD85052.1 MAG: histidine kinase [Sulfuricurvum sp. RIFCSPLOWO2_02_FULL_43_45]OHD86971.1 MAG: histidine kinase [Sulfuricurvum sp. RIFCSPLOWO2_02_43_6]OHD88761.1 MAG: histidine kinase [Sulfuricurvum sp. RIFCSPLOWO2_12_FULL_43_24]OHD92756.1 MAG: histidine kinase [Sulfuricurvum sp. RIFCSPLOWO2_12_43_5]
MTSYKGFIKTFSTISLQRKLLLFIVIALSMIFTLSGMFIYTLVNDSFIQSEKKHIKIISESLSSKVSIWYFINKDNQHLNMDEFLKSMLIDYHLENITFKDQNGILISEVKSSEYTLDDPYNLTYEKAVYTPGEGNEKNKLGTLQIAYAHHTLKELSMKYYMVGTILIVLLTLYFYLEMRLLKELLTPLRKIASEIKGYIPGDKLVFESINRHRDDVISEIVNGFLHMQHNIDETMEKKEIEKENNRIKDALLMKQSRFIEMGTMINNIAHQWKQPLNIIELCITDLTVKSMMGSVDQEYQHKLFSNMHNQVEFMSKTIDIFKNFLNDDQSDKKMEVFTLKKAITDSMHLLGSRLENNKVSITFNLDEKACAYGSISEMEQVILIIINNAIDALSTKITLECTQSKKGNLLKIYDNGGGFSPDIIDKVFDAYFTTKHQSQGTGLGLFIAKMIVEIKLNGTIEAHNFKDGALFIIKLPFPPTYSPPLT